MNRLTPMVAIARRELLSYFCSPIAYVALTLFLLACGLLFARDFVPGKPVGMRTLMEWMVWMLVVIIPVLSMGLLAQEWATGTMETMMTAPVDETSVVLGKFAGLMAFFLVLLAPTLVYLGMLWLYGSPDVGPILTGYLGIVLVGGLFISVGLMFSAMTRSVVVAAVSAAAALFLITIVPWLQAGNLRLPQVWRDALSGMVYSRYEDFSRGVIDLSNIAFFVIGTGLCLFVTVKIVESRRWK